MGITFTTTGHLVYDNDNLISNYVLCPDHV